jgi:hypothetical protein
MAITPSLFGAVPGDALRKVDGPSFRYSWPNPRFEGTAGKQRLPVPRPLRGRAAPQAELQGLPPIVQMF